MGADRREAFRAFTTGVAFVTTHGRKGPNVMSAEWTFNVSYDPFLIAVLLEPGEATYDAVVETHEFGVNIVAEDQVAAMGFAGHFSKHDTDKLSSERFETYPAAKIRAPMIRGCLLNAECRVVQQVPMGDHVAFVGEVLAFSVDPMKKPVVLHRGSRHLGPRIERGVIVVAAVTPDRVAGGGTVVVGGELTAPDRARQPVTVIVRDAAGEELGRAETVTDEYGYFEASLSAPDRAGRYVIAVHSMGAEGRADLTVN